MIALSIPHVGSIETDDNSFDESMSEMQTTNGIETNEQDIGIENRLLYDKYGKYINNIIIKVVKIRATISNKIH